MNDVVGSAKLPWSDWVPFAAALATAPKLPGVYVARERRTSQVIYVGMAGERKGQGIKDRLAAYTSGKGLVSGLGEAAFDRAIADETWLRERLAEVVDGHPRSAKAWGRLAIERADLEVCWSTTTDRKSAVVLEAPVVTALRSSLWNI